ncbi:MULTISPECIES: TadA family conjugal transfer-associated ATPase [unclassified Crossiella]|uniref:TadA family conjugal transfer-associated ATPase n=1 Tax=unclassified Crossiella TaxID=2620835 RepID=UPI001FFEE8EF|nr:MULTISPECIES: TadA family conjugal transfer-associated ATPase [unclassified Crossiella]MCK2237671.1 TadA family conjugal transfer-associated ATPase [Crossiella sp. S99.2]MCK2254957.1 TadA family conjugal transfer-associated ATPase [Crossiella sp. S99.1]
MDKGLIDRVRNRLAQLGSRPTPANLAEAIRAETGALLTDADLLDTLRLLDRELIGAGPLEPLLRMDGVTDVLVTGPGRVWVDRGHGLTRTAVTLPDEEAVRRLAQRLALAAGRRLDDAQPFVDGWLPGGVRLHAVLAPIAAGGTCISLRALKPAAHDLATLRYLGTFAESTENLLRRMVKARLSFLVVGGTGSGKSTLLNALLGCVDPAERIVTVEEAEELHPAHPHVVRLVARPPNIEGAGEITLRDLVRQALRMRPDRLVLGEARGAEIADLLAAMNTGHEGCAGTLHANSPTEVPARLEALAALGGMSRPALHSQLSAALQVVLHLRRDDHGSRALAAIGVLDRTDDYIRVVPVWQQNHGWTTAKSRLTTLLRTREPAPT